MESRKKRPAGGAHGKPEGVIRRRIEWKAGKSDPQGLQGWRFCYRSLCKESTHTGILSGLLHCGHEEIEKDPRERDFAQADLEIEN